MQKKDYRHLTIGLYLNYFVHGVGLIILAQNMQELGRLWGQPLANVSYVISGIGIGRLLAYLILGNLADKYDRKLFVYFGMFSYFVFFLGVLIVHNLTGVYLLAILAGIANSALDSGTYPVFLEIGTNNGASNILIKSFMSLGEFFLPLMVSFLEIHNLWFGWSFVFASIVLILNIFVLIPVKFPAKNNRVETKLNPFISLSITRHLALGVLLSLYGYVSMATMILYTQWISLYAGKQLNFNNFQAHLLVSLYSIGSIIGVLILFILLRRNITEIRLLMALNIVSMISLIVVNFSSNRMLVYLVSFTFGFSAAGGVMQTGLNLFLKIYPKHKGKVTGIFFTFGSIASFSIPIITGILSKISIEKVLKFELILTLIGVLISLGIKIISEKKV